MLKGVWNRTADLLERPLKKEVIIENRYEVLDVLGRGSYGTSYLVMDAKHQSTVVLKLLRLHKRIFKSGKTAFEQEQKLLQSLNQPYFPAFFEKGDINGIPFFTMEYVEGKTFEQLIFEEEKKYSEKATFQFGLLLLEIIDWLHQHGVVHRDIRIPNVICQDHQIRLIDFGLARRFDICAPRPAVDLNQIKRMLSPVSDFYALGHFLLFLLYSTYEHNEKNPEKSWDEELMLSHQAVSIIRKLLVIDEPYQSCQEIKQDIIHLLSL